MAWTIEKKGYAREIEDPETGEKAEIKLRKLTEGDYQDRDGLSISMRVEQRRRRKGRKARKNSDTEMDFTPGRVRLFEIERSLIAWNLPLDLNTMNIKNLDPAVAKQIHDHIIELNPYFFEDSEADEDEEEGDYEDAEDEEGELHQFPIADNSEADDNDQEFGEYDGPKGNAGTS